VKAAAAAVYLLIVVDSTRFHLDW